MKRGLKPEVLKPPRICLTWLPSLHLHQRGAVRAILLELEDDVLAVWRVGAGSTWTAGSVLSVR
jgi:hypothetical protein